MVKMTNEQFTWKVFCEAPIEFLRDEMELEQKEVEVLFGRQIYDLILNFSKGLSDKQKEVFMVWNCKSLNIEPLEDEFRF